MTVIAVPHVWAIWRFPKSWGYLQSSSHFSRDFPWNKPSSVFGVPPWRAGTPAKFPKMTDLPSHQHQHPPSHQPPKKLWPFQLQPGECTSDDSDVRCQKGSSTKVSSMCFFWLQSNTWGIHGVHGTHDDFMLMGYNHCDRQFSWLNLFPIMLGVWWKNLTLSRWVTKHKALTKITRGQHLLPIISTQNGLVSGQHQWPEGEVVGVIALTLRKS